MALIKGGFLRILQTLLYFICFCCAAVVLGIYSYFLAVQSERGQYIQRYEKAVEGLSGAAVLYTIFAVILTCCLAGVSFFSFLGLVLDICFVASFIAIAIMTRDGAGSCTGTVTTPLGTGNVNDPASGYGADGFGTGNGENVTYAVSNRTACRLNTAAFAVSIIAIVFFIITALMQIAIVRSHRKDKRYGPSPDNGYTSGPAKKRGFFARKSKKNHVEKDAELGAVGAGTAAAVPHHHHNTRESHDTSTTAAGSGLVHDKYENAPAQGTHGGYYTQPNGTGANPYGYDNTTTPNAYTTGNARPIGTATNY